MRPALLFLIALLFQIDAQELHSQEKISADFPALSSTTDWPWWRGMSRSGWADASSSPPVNFSTDQNVKWRSMIPGRGHSSPIVVGDKVFLTTADEARQLHSVLAFDKGSGEMIWSQQINQGGFPERNHPKNTEATPTLASDGERLFAAFFHHKTVELITLDFAGKIGWRVTVGPFNPTRYEYGYAPSPVLYKNSVIIAAEHDGESYIASFDRSTGKGIWTASRPANITFSTPVIAHIAGRDQLLLSGSGSVASYDPTTGAELWKVAATTAATCGTIVWAGDMVFASGGYPDAGTYGIKVTANDAVVVWKNNQKCYEQSMIVVNDFLYALTDNGVLYCWATNDGKEQWKQRLSGPVSSSPVYAGGNIYWANESSNYFVFRPNPRMFEQVSVNRLGDESFASPAISGDLLFLRVARQEGAKRQEYLYCLEP